MRLKELIHDRYEVLGGEKGADVGKGVFSNVTKCVDTKDPSKRIVAIKMIRNNDMMRKAAEKEVLILKRLNARDKNRGIIRMFETFDYRNHMCLVFEAMTCSLREGLRKYSKPGRKFLWINVYAKNGLDVDVGTAFIFGVCKCTSRL